LRQKAAGQTVQGWLAVLDRRKGDNPHRYVANKRGKSIMSAFNSARRKLRRLLIGSVAATAVATIAIAANPGLPFTEQFLDTNERDATVTTADWGITTAGVLQLAAEASLENLSLSGAAMGDGLSSPTTRGIALGDFDGDGDLDAAVANSGSEINLVYENTDGSISTAATNLGTDAANSRSIKAGDMDLDGDIDLVVGNRNGFLVWHSNDGTGTFSDAIAVNARTDRVWPIELVDLDDDGDLDIISGQEDDRVNRIYRNRTANNSNTIFDEEDIGTDTFSTRSMAVGDVNGDGALDLVTGDHGANNHLYYGDGNGGFQAGVEVQASQAWNTFSVALADLNGDGALDLVEGVQRDSNNLSGETKVYLNNGAGGFLAPSNVAGSNNLHTTVALVLLDFDKDGDIDILEGNNGGWDHDNDGNTDNIAQPNRLFLNDGTANFTAGPELTIATDNEQTYAMEAGDLDGDGILDFVTGNQTGDNAAYTLTGTPSANPAVQQLSGVAQSTQVNDGSEGNMRYVRLQVNANDISTPGLSDIDFYLANGNNGNWVPAPLDRHVEFTGTKTGPIRWRAVLSTATPTQMPTLSELTVDHGNYTVPSFVGPDTFSGQQNQDLTPVQVDFSDPDGDRLTYELSGLPSNSGISIDADTGIISGTPNANDAAAAPITITAAAFDGTRVRTGIITFSLGSGGNQQPTVVTPIPDQSTTEGAAFSLDASGNFSDPNGSNLSYAATGFPASITMNAAGVASGTPGAADVGSWNVTVTATDPGGLFVQDTFALTVASGNQAPVLNPSIGAHSGTVGTAVNIDVSGNFSDPDGDTLTFSGTGAPSSLSISAAGVVSGTPVAADVGTHSITITATDPGGLSASDTFVLTINEAAPPPPPPPPPPSSGGGGGSLNLWELVAAALLFAGIGINRRRQHGRSIMMS